MAGWHVNSFEFADQLSQRVHVGIWYILRAQRGSHIPTLRPKYIPYSYMDPLGLWSLRLQPFLQAAEDSGHVGVLHG